MKMCVDREFYHWHLSTALSTVHAAEKEVSLHVLMLGVHTLWPYM